MRRPEDSNDSDVMMGSRSPGTGTAGTTADGGGGGSNGSLNPYGGTDRRMSTTKLPERKMSSSKGPERKMSSSKAPERKLSSAIDPMYIHLNEDVDESDEDDDDDPDIDVNDLDDDYDEESRRSWNCCDEPRINWSIFGHAMSKQGRQLKESVKKIDWKKYGRQCCSMEILKKRLPIIQWAPKYSLPDLQGDLIAGVTVGLTVIPQSIAYAFIAGVPAQNGLYSAFIGSFVYVLFGSAKDITLGPSAVASLLTALFATSPIPNDASVAILLAFFVGFIYLAMFLLGLGFIMDFISYPVLKGFTSAAAITIAMSQVKKWWGQTGVPRDFLPQLYWTVAKIPQSRLWDFLLGVCCIALIVLLRKLKEVKWKTEFDDLTIGWKIVNKTIWLLGTGRNILAIVFASIASFIFLENNMRPFTLTGYIPPGIPPFQAPPFSFTDRQKNVTYTLSDMSNIIGGGYIIVPVLGLIEAMAIGNVFARKNDYRIDPNQELLAYGIGNVLTAMFSGYPITGTFSRTAVAAQSGVRTPASGIATGAIVLIALQFLTPLFYYIPDASLAVVIILAVVDMVTFHKLWIFWKTRKIDLLPWLVSFIISFVYSIAYGVLIGAGLSLVLLLYPASRPKIKVIKHEARTLLESGEPIASENTVIVAKFYSGLLYPAIEYMKDVIIPLYLQTPLPKGVIFDFHHVAVIDTTTVQGIRILLESFNKKGIRVVFCQLQKSADEILTKSKPKFFTKAANIQESTRIILGLDSAVATEASPRKRRENNNMGRVLKQQPHDQLEVIRQQLGREGEVNLAFESGK